MKEATITSAPQAYLSDSLYEEWMSGHTGTKEDFLKFMTVPSSDREVFLSPLDCDVEIVEGLGTVTYSA